ncbi:DUF4214 domain-containing protein [Pseudomonas aeruginosa]|nr:DUF4214 domain-containing protein [Pseudomonas aeruginosa]EKX5071659.1 DUF4214 domain-containing protein [Pseudomonas aeruginosa]
MSTQSDLAELYTTFFDRAPDAGGLAYWVAQVEGGQITLAQVAENWLNEQPEGMSKFPSGQTDAQFIEAMYNNLLGRAPDTGGSQYWLDQLGVWGAMEPKTNISPTTSAQSPLPRHLPR